MKRSVRGLTTVALAVGLALGTAAAQAGVSIGVGVSVNVAPPPLPVYEQPPIPGAGFVWTPGYWAWSDDGYYWVPGTWVFAPVGMLWTPGYWGWDDGAYFWHTGYWGPHVGFYGGVNYGFGYVGVGYAGGYWEGGHLFYNRAVNNVPESVHITNVYNKTVINNYTVNRVSFNGGAGGIQARPTQGEMMAAHEHHEMPVSAQMRQQDTARGNPALRDAFNHGNPAVAATARPGEFSGRGVVAAREAVPERGFAPQTRESPQVHAPVAHNEPRAQSQTPFRAENNRPQIARSEARPQNEPSFRPQAQSRPESRPQVRTESRPEYRPSETVHNSPPPTQERVAHASPRPEARPEARPENHSGGGGGGGRPQSNGGQRRDNGRPERR